MQVSAHLALPGISLLPDTAYTCTVLGERPELARPHVAQATEDAILKYGYPKIGTSVVIDNPPGTSLCRNLKGRRAWVIGYYPASFSSREGDYAVVVAYNTKDQNNVYDSDGLNSSWMSLDDGTRMSDMVSYGATQRLACKGCGKLTPKGSLSLGYCSKARCTVRSMCENL